MRRVFIINPVAGNGRSIRVGQYLESVCQKYDMPYLIYYTTQKDDITKYVKTMTNATDLIYSIGGDGTLHRVINGIVESNSQLCVIPSGTGNDFYKSLNKEKSHQIIDLGKVNDKYFINTFSVGVDAEVAKNLSLFRQQYISNKMRYGLATIYTIMNYSAKDLVLDSFDNKYTLVAVCNGKYYGNGFKVSPESVLNDGYLNLLTAKPYTNWQMLQLLAVIKKGHHICLPGVYYEKILKISIKSMEKIVAELDGETYLNNSFNIEVCPKVLRLYQDKLGKEAIAKICHK